MPAIKISNLRPSDREVYFIDTNVWILALSKSKPPPNHYTYKYLEFFERIIEPIEIFGLDRFGESEIVIKARIKTSPGDQWAVGREFRKRLKKAFDQQGIEIPFPHRTIYWGEKINTLELEVNKKEH